MQKGVGQDSSTAQRSVLSPLAEQTATRAWQAGGGAVLKPGPRPRAEINLQVSRRAARSVNGGGDILMPDIVGHLVCGNGGVLLLNTEITKFDVMSITKGSWCRGPLCLTKCFRYAFSSMQIPGGSCWVLNMKGEEIQAVTNHLVENTNFHLFSILI